MPIKMQNNREQVETTLPAITPDGLTTSVRHYFGRMTHKPDERKIRKTWLSAANSFTANDRFKHMHTRRAFPPLTTSLTHAVENNPTHTCSAVSCDTARKTLREYSLHV